MRCVLTQRLVWLLHQTPLHTLNTAHHWTAAVGRASGRAVQLPYSFLFIVSENNFRQTTVHCLWHKLFILFGHGGSGSESKLSSSSLQSTLLMENYPSDSPCAHLLMLCQSLCQRISNSWYSFHCCSVCLSVTLSIPWNVSFFNCGMYDHCGQRYKCSAFFCVLF